MAKPEYPADHQPGMKVPKGGSSCTSCEYLGANGATCKNRYFIAWHGTNRLPAPADEYCSDWYQPRKKLNGKDHFFAESMAHNAS